MEFREIFPVFNKLSARQQELILNSLITKSVKKGEIIHSANEECSGLLIIKSGQLRAYILSDEGREITVYRLFDRDICLFSASCVIRSVQFDITVSAQKDTELYIIPAKIYKIITEESAAAANFTNELMADRFSEIMWLIEQIMWKSLDRRVAAFLLEETAVENTESLKITHEAIANHLGSSREVITRMLRYFQKEGLVKLSRGQITVTDAEGLRSLA